MSTLQNLGLRSRKRRALGIAPGDGAKSVAKAARPAAAQLPQSATQMGLVTIEERAEARSGSAELSHVAQGGGGCEREADKPAQCAPRRSAAPAMRASRSASLTPVMQSLAHGLTQSKLPAQIPAQPDSPVATPSGDAERTPRTARAPPAVARCSSPISPPRLPAHLQQIEEAFIAVESTLLFFQGKRGDQPLFTALQPHLQRATGRTFPPEMLQSILGVWPEAYDVTAVWPPSRGPRIPGAVEVQDWLICSPSARSTPAPVSPADLGARAQVALLSNPAQSRTAATAAAAGLGARRAEMRARLLQHVHAEQDSAPPKALLPERARRGGPIARPHRPPEAGALVAQPGAAQEHAAAPQASRVQDAAEAAAVGSSKPATDPKLAGLSAALVEKIMLREAAKKSAAAAAPAVRHANLQRQLPNIALAVRAALHRERGSECAASALPMAQLLDRLRYRFASANISTEELRELLALLGQTAPQWFSTVDMAKGAIARIQNRVPWPF